VSDGAEDGRAALRSALVRRAGGYLQNVVRVDGVTCAVCATFVVNGYTRCWQCKRHYEAYGGQLADLAVPLTYGVYGRQSGHLMHAYKSERPGETQRDFDLLLLSGLVHHSKCVELVVGKAVSARVAVPSLSGRWGVHPLVALTNSRDITKPGLFLQPAPAARTQRAVVRGMFTINDPRQIRGRHIMVIDDTWTTGGNAQSAALALRDAGASHVSVLVAARWLRLDNPPIAEAAKRHLVGDFRPLHCPVTGGCCP